LGLAKIRKGDVEAGKDDLETAVSLDPNNAVLRSYLGKAFYELRDKNYASTEYKLAKEMDPKDPTPWFYDAILKQTTNRPVEALHDMQKAIELNDNRGVYRSKLLLDSDNAARSASMGRIYNDLGFQQRGLLEGWNSINSDPSNYSAHRLLADNYAAMPRHEIARVSELLKSQLLQPVNITPVQPQAAESNILILDSLGPSITSFNEYNPMFTRNRFALQATGFYGSHDTKSDEVVHSGVWDKFSYSLGQFHYQTDGFRPNNQQKKDAYNVFVQGEVAKDTTLQFEYRRSELEFGDINQGFYTNNYSTAVKGQTETNIFRGGGHHKFSENSDLLMSIVHREEQSSGVEAIQIGSAELARKNNGTQYELQQIYRTKYLDLSAGMNYLINQNDAAGATISISGLPIAFNLKTNKDAEHKAFYVYANAKPISELTVTLGLTQDFYDLNQGIDLDSSHAGARLERNPLNPKFGLLWTPSKDTTFRFAAFQSLKRGIIQNQTLEPTQISGFNQFYNDVDGAIAKRIGFGIDHKLNSKLFVGAEVSRRYLDVPFLAANGDAQFNSTNWNEKNARAYLNWVPNEWVSFGLDYTYEKLNRNKLYVESSNYNNSSFTHLETHRSQAYVSFFHPSGLLSKFNVGYVSQHEDFFDQALDKVNPANSGFWLLDTELGYRLPKRHGIVTLGIKNLLDERFNYQGVDVNQPALPQGRFFFSRLTLSF
jgi:tetratricopeptide (TPR) repeat protein